jgi:hypothetical protein
MALRRPVALLTLVLGFLALAALPRVAAAVSSEGTPGGPLRPAYPVTVTIQLSPEVRNALRKLPTDALEPGPTVRLAVGGVKAPAGTSIRAFLNLPQAGAETPTNDPHYVGAMTSFEDPVPESAGDDFLLDATNAMRRLKRNERVLAGDTLAVTLVVAPGSAPEEASIPVEKVVLSIEDQPER